MGTKTVTETVEREVKTCDICGKEDEKLGYGRCTGCGDDVCDGCGSLEGDSFCCPSCAASARVLNREIEVLESKLSEKIEALDEAWELACIAAHAERHIKEPKKDKEE